MVESVISNILGALAASGMEYGGSKVIDYFKSVSNELQLKNARIDSAKVKEIAEKLGNKAEFQVSQESNIKNLARWYEEDEEQFKSKKRKGFLEPEILIRHIIYEELFSQWFNEWHYEVTIGKDFPGLDGLEFNSDIHAKRRTLHGEFEVIIIFVCSDPPDIDRILSTFEESEAWVKGDKKFSERDIFIVATPFSFTTRAVQAMTRQDKEEKYTVLPLEGDDIERLSSLSEEKRFTTLIEMVESVQNKLEAEKQHYRQ